MASNRRQTHAGPKSTNLDQFSQSRWLRHFFAMQKHALNVEFNRFRNQGTRFIQRAGHGNAARQIRNGRAYARRPLLEKNRVFHFSIPACFIIFLSVPTGTSTDGCPATVTVPDFAGWRNWRWLPLWRTCTYPSLSTMRIASLTFTEPVYRARAWDRLSLPGTPCLGVRPESSRTRPCRGFKACLAVRSRFIVLLDAGRWMLSRRDGRCGVP